MKREGIGYSSIVFSFAQICGSLIEVGINTADFTSFFLPRLVSLAADPIVNVRIVVSRMIYILYTSGDYHNEIMEIAAADDEIRPSCMLDEITYKLAVDDDPDVNFYIHNIINEEVLDAYRQKRQEEKDEEMKQSEQNNKSISANDQDHEIEEEVVEEEEEDECKRNENTETNEQNEQSEQNEKHEESEQNDQNEQHDNEELTKQPLPSPPSPPQHTMIADEDEIMAEKTDHLLLSSLDHVVPPSNPKQLVN